MKSLITTLSLLVTMTVLQANASEFILAAVQKVETAQNVEATRIATPKVCKRVFGTSSRPSKSAVSWTDGIYEESDPLIIITFVGGVALGVIYFTCL